MCISKMINDSTWQWVGFHAVYVDKKKSSRRQKKNVIIHSEMKPMKISQPNWNDVRNSPLLIECFCMYWSHWRPASVHLLCNAFIGLDKYRFDQFFFIEFIRCPFLESNAIKLRWKEVRAFFNNRTHTLSNRIAIEMVIQCSQKVIESN